MQVSTDISQPCCYRTAAGIDRSQKGPGDAESTFRLCRNIAQSHVYGGIRQTAISNIVRRFGSGHANPSPRSSASSWMSVSGTSRFAQRQDETDAREHR